MQHSSKQHSLKVTEQPSLTTSTGRSWLIIGALLTLLCGGLLSFMSRLAPAGWGITGAAITILLYIVLVITKFAVAAPRRRLAAMAIITALIPLTFIIVGGTIMVTELNG